MPPLLPAFVLAVAAASVVFAQVESPASGVRFVDVTAEAGIRFRHDHFGAGRFYLIESMTGGAVFFDADGDGWHDVLLLQGGPLPGSMRPPLESVFYRNDGRGRFVDMTARSGLGMRGQFAVGGAAADYDNDGDTDLFVTTYQGNALFRNNGRGRFEDVAARAGVRTPPLATSAAFVDVNADGWLDLFVGRYTDYDVAGDRPCHLAGGPTYCGPHMYAAAVSRLFVNNGDGTFHDATASSGVASRKARALGVAAADYNDDGLIDIFVASDRAPNLLFVNQGGTRFREQAVQAGVAVDPNGTALAGMGVDVADYNNDGRFDLFVTNFAREPNSLYSANPDGTFYERSSVSGVRQISLPYLGWGLRFADLDGDGYRDLFVVNGHIYPDGAEHASPGLPGSAAPLGYRQPAQIYLNQRNGRFTDVAQHAGRFFAEKQVSRGAAFADYDNDGDLDVLIANNNSPATLLRNDTPAPPRRAHLKLRGGGCNRDAVGARIRVTTGSLTQTEVVRSGTSYLSDHDRRVIFSLPGSEPAAAEIRWPCGAVQRLALQSGSFVIREDLCLRKARH